MGRQRDGKVNTLTVKNSRTARRGGVLACTITTDNETAGKPQDKRLDETESAEAKTSGGKNLPRSVPTVPRLSIAHQELNTSCTTVGLTKFEPQTTVVTVI